MRDRLIRFNHFLLLWILFTIVLYYGKVILIPVAFGAMLAMLMAPVCSGLDARGLPRTLSVIVCILILLLVFALSIWVVVAQIASFNEDLPLIEQKMRSLAGSLQTTLEKEFRISANLEEQIFGKDSWFAKGAISQAGPFVKGTLATLGGIAITLVVTFLLLLHKEKYQTFFLKVSGGNSDASKKKMLESITSVAQRYLVGRAISMFILFILYSIALFSIGIKNALLLSAIGALVNIIPYIGPFLAGVFPFFVALVTEDTLQPAIWVVITFTVIQAIDNYFVTPFVLGGEVSLSALSTILGIICGGIVWGIAGMILFIPMLSIAKIVFDHVESLKPYGLLIGDKGKSTTSRITQWYSRKFGSKPRNLKDVIKES